MRLGTIWGQTWGASYRVLGPMQEMERRGHDVVWASESGEIDERSLAGCDLVHVYQHADPDVQALLSALAHAGSAITWDNDVDITSLPEESPAYKQLGGLAGRDLYGQQMRTAKLAQTVTTTNDHLARRYRGAGLSHVEVVENHLLAHHLTQPRHHDGIVIGWVAALEHRADAARIPIAEALRRLQAEYPEVHVECIGVNLGLRERYRHDEYVSFDELPARIAGFDVGIAPLADIPFNRSRSDIKLKEYAAAGIPWLASPVGPYADLGVEQGGRLVPDGEWFEALRWMVVKRTLREQLAQNAADWAKRKTIRSAVLQWEGLFTESIRLRQAADGSRAHVR